MYGDNFLDTAPKARSMEEITDTLYFLKIKNFHSSKSHIKRIIRKATDLEKICAKDTADEGLLFKTYKEVLKLNKKKINNFK